MYSSLMMSLYIVSFGNNLKLKDNNINDIYNNGSKEICVENAVGSLKLSRVIKSSFFFSV